MTASREEAITALIIDASGAKTGAAEFVAAAEKVKTANGGVVGANDAQVKTQQRVVEALGRTTRAVDALEKRYSPLSAAMTQYARDEEKLIKFMQRGGQESERARKQLEALRKEREKFNKVNAGGAQAKPRGITGSQATQLSYQANDIFAQAAVGTNPLIIAAQQGPQITQIFGGLKNTLALIPGPAKAAAAAIVGIGVAAAVVGSRISDITSETRKLDALTSALNPKLKGMAAQLRAEESGAMSRGASRDEAKAITQTLATARNLPNELRKDLVGLSVDLAAALGTEPQSAAAKLADALSRGAAGIKQLDDELGFLSPAQRESITLLDEQGKRAEALQVAMSALGDRVGGTATAMKGAWSEAFHEIGLAFDAFLEKIGNSDIANSLAKTLKSAGEGWQHYFKGEVTLGGEAGPNMPVVSSPSGTAKPLQLSAADLDALTRAVIAEAGGEGAAGQSAVARVILNRVQAGNFGSGVQGVVNAKNQFEPVGKAGGDWRNLPEPTAAQREAVRKMAEGAANGEADPTGGALYFLNRQIAAQRGTDFGKGNKTQTAEIGGHTFYKEFGKGGAEERSPDAIKRIQEAAHATDRETEALKGNAAQRQIALAVMQAEEAERAQPGSDNESVKAAGQQAALKVTRDMAMAVRDQTESVDLNTRSILAQADAYGKSTAAGVEAEAQAQAAAEALQNPALDPDARAKQLLRDRAASGLLRGAQGNAQLAEGNSDLRSIADAAKFGQAAEAAARRAVDAANQYRDAIAAAEAIGDTKTVERLERERAVTEELTEAREQDLRAINALHRAQDDTDELSALDLELTLIGKTNLERQKAIRLLQLKQRLVGEGYSGDDLDAEYEKERKSVELIAEKSDQLDRESDAYESMKDLGTDSLHALSDAMGDLASGGAKASDVLRKLAVDLLKLAADSYTNASASGSGSGGSDWLSALSSVVGLAGGGSGVPAGVGSADTSFMGNMDVPMFHTGGIVGLPSGSGAKSVPSHVFANAPKFHSGGMAGGLANNEVPAILQHGEEVLTAGDPRHRKNGGRGFSGGGGHTINVTIQTPDANSFRKSETQTAAQLGRAVSIANRRNG